MIVPVQTVLAGAQPVGLTLHVVAGFVRVATHPGIFDPPTPLPAALAIENGAVLYTADRGFARFPGLRWCHPLDAAD